MSDKQLTVAELLAKAGKDADTGRKRRRRRSLEEGGISVAELTGNIPRVTAKPAESKHSSQPIDAEPITLGGEPDIVLSIVDENEPVRLTTDSFPAITPDVIAAHQSQKEKEAAGQAESGEEEQPQSSSSSEALGGSDAETTIVKQVRDEEEDGADEAPAAKPASSERLQAVKKGTLLGGEPLGADTEDLGVETEGEEDFAEDADLEADADIAEDEDADFSEGETTNFAAVADEDLEDEVHEPDFEDDADLAAAETTNFAIVEDGDDLDIQDDEVYAEDEAFDDEVALVDVDDAELAEELDEEDEPMSIVAVAAMAVAGIILGIAIFFGFEALWSALPRPAVAALALVVTGILVGIVHMMRTSRDTTSKILAGVVGLIMTFGPMLIAG